VEIQTIEFDAVEFEGADGKIHTIRQCSLTDREELRTRLEQLHQAIKDAPVGWTIGDLYDQDKLFRHRADRALKSCGISPKWVSIPQLTALLFTRKEGDRHERGWLLDLNFPRPKVAIAAGEAQNYAQIVAALSAYVEGMDKAIKLAKEHPFGELLDILRAKSELVDKQRRKTDKAYAQECEKRESQKRAKDALTAIQRKLYGDHHG